LFFRILAETNQSPTDSIEGKSELIFPFFDVEYFRIEFVLISIAEYRIIISFGFVTLIISRNFITFVKIYDAVTFLNSFTNLCTRSVTSGSIRWPIR